MLVVTMTSKRAGARTTWAIMASTMNSSQRDVAGTALRLLAALLEEHAVADLQHIGLVHGAHVALALPRHLEGDARDARAGGARDAPQRDGDILRHQHLGVAVLHVAVGVEAFGVLAHDDEIECAELGRNAGIGARRPDVGEEVETFAEKRSTD